MTAAAGAHLSDMKYVLAGLLMVGVAACGPLAPFVPDTARLAPGALGSGGDVDVGAVNQAQWAFADSGRTYGRPVEAARAAAALDYIAGEFTTSPRWGQVSALTKEQLLEGRREMRAALGVVPGMSSQRVVDALARAGTALAAGRDDDARTLLGAPVFTGTGAETLARLSNMPYLRMANVSTMRAGNELFDSDQDRN